MAIINQPQMSWPAIYSVGEIHVNPVSGEMSTWDGSKWLLIRGRQDPVRLIPSPDELNENPSLKQAWEEYLVIRKLLGL